MATQMTGAFWNVDNPDKPWGPFDVTAELIFPVYWNGWCDQIAGTLAEALIDAMPHFITERTISADGKGVIVRVALNPVYRTSIVLGQKYAFKIRVRSNAQSGAQQDGRSFFLKVLDR